MNYLTMAAMKKGESGQADSYNTDEALELYDRYGKPLEAEHSGEYLAVSPEGKTLIGSNLLSVTKRATKTFGPGNVIFKIGEIAVGKWL